MGENREHCGAGPSYEAEKGCKKGRQLALFGIRSGVAWVADDVFVTRRSGDLLVERWFDHRVATIALPADSNGTMRIIWEKLNEVAIDDLPPESRSA